MVAGDHLGATIVGLAVAWHAVSLGRDLVAGRDRPFAITVTHYVASACLLPVGAAFGALLASPVGDSLHDGLLLAHEAVNLIGFLGLAASGTLIPMSPALWRTRMSPLSHPAVSLAVQLAGIEGEPELVYPRKERKGLIRYFLEEMATTISALMVKQDTGIRYLYTGESVRGVY